MPGAGKADGASSVQTIQLTPQEQNMLAQIQRHVKQLMALPTRSEEQQQRLRQLGQVQQQILTRGRVQAIIAQQQAAAAAAANATSSAAASTLSASPGVASTSKSLMSTTPVSAITSMPVAPFPRSDNIPLTENSKLGPPNVTISTAGVIPTQSAQTGHRSGLQHVQTTSPQVIHTSGLPQLRMSNPQGIKSATTVLPQTGVPHMVQTSATSPIRTSIPPLMQASGSVQIPTSVPPLIPVSSSPQIHTSATSSTLQQLQTNFPQHTQTTSSQPLQTSDTGLQPIHSNALQSSGLLQVRPNFTAAGSLQQKQFIAPQLVTSIGQPNTPLSSLPVNTTPVRPLQVQGVTAMQRVAQSQVPPLNTVMPSSQANLQLPVVSLPRVMSVGGVQQIHVTSANVSQQSEF